MNRVLITGGNGFLGSHLARFFLQKGHAVSVISRSCSNIADILESVQFIKHETPGYGRLVGEIRAFNPTVVIHCAWDGGSTYNDVNSTKQFGNIAYGTELLDCVDAATFIGVGSFSEYGHMSSPVSETSPVSPITLYGHAKSCFRTVSRVICEQKGLRWTWVRPCLVYGSNDVATRVFPSTIRKLVAGEHVILDSCKDIVDYLHIDDFCRGVDKVIASSTTGIVNLCSGEEYPVRWLMEYVRDEVSGAATVTFDPARDRRHLSSYVVGDPSVLRSLGWAPTVDIRTGLRSLVVEEKVGQLIAADLDGLHPE